MPALDNIPTRQRRRTSRNDNSLSTSRRPSLAGSNHSRGTDENFLPPNPQPNLYDNLATFSFGSPSSSNPANNRAAIAPWDAVDDDDDDDREERVRHDRAKMRAIDDGTRRPSLPSNLTLEEIHDQRKPSQPINIPDPKSSNNNRAGGSSNNYREGSYGMDLSPLSSWPPADARGMSAEPDSPPDLHITDPEEEEDNNALKGFDLSYIMAPPTTANGSPHPGHRPSVSSPNNAAGSSSHGASSFLFPFTSLTRDARRPSTASALSDGQNDTFFRHINKNDTEYGDRRKVWSFRRRDHARLAVRDRMGGDSHSGVNGPSSDARRSQSQHWECYAVGRFSVSRCRNTKEAASDKAPPQRLLIRPYYSHSLHSPISPISPQSPTSVSRENARQNYPTALIHKHSRANAFSIFRASKLRGQHMSASQCVLLAPLKVQVHYTETRSTRALMTHGTLESQEDNLIRGGRSHGSVRSDIRDRSTPPSSSIANSKSQTSSGGSTTSTGTVTGVDGGTSPPKPTLSVSVASSSTLANPNGVLHHTDRIRSSASVSPQARSPVSINAGEESDQFDDDPTAVSRRIQPFAEGRFRKSHKDAFQSLDSHQLDNWRTLNGPTNHYQHSTHEIVPVPVEVARVKQSRFGTALKRAFAVSPSLTPGSSGHTQSEGGGEGNGEPNGTYIPPWLTLPPRAQQEKNERTLHQLNKSFEDVGLLPHRKKQSSHYHSSSGLSGSGHMNSGGTSASTSLLKRAFVGRNGAANGSQNGRGSNVANGDAFEEVPEDSPVMLLPMWPSSETTEKGKGAAAGNGIPLPERRYLLIYYIAFGAEKKGDKGDRKRTRGTNSKDSREERQSSDSFHHSTSSRSEKDTIMTAFRVVAKVLSYEDVRTCGLRLPNEGIEVSPAVQPNSPGYAYNNMTIPLSNFGDTMVIAICPSAESGIEFVPEGLDKLGLCYRLSGTEQMLPISSIADPTERERLSPVGRAIVEMAWCGCLSVMGLAVTL